jgi:hypothetical protein
MCPNVLTRILQRQFALKKIRCPGGNEDVRQAMREVEAYRRFKYVVHYRLPRAIIDRYCRRHPNIIRILVRRPNDDIYIAHDTKCRLDRTQL